MITGFEDFLKSIFALSDILEQYGSGDLGGFQDANTETDFLPI